MTKNAISIAHNSEICDNIHLLGFKIKSEFEDSPILFNSNEGSDINFILTNVNVMIIEKANKIKDLCEKIEFLNSKDVAIKFDNYSNYIFYNNLLLIDSSLPQIVAEMMLISYSNRKVKLKEVVDDLKRKNPLNFDYSRKQDFYEHKIKRLLTDMALGMTDNIPWNGQYDDTIGYIIAKSEGKIFCTHIYYKSIFQDYLFNNTKFDTPSTSRHGFGTIFEKEGELFLRLNLQIRFI